MRLHGRDGLVYLSIRSGDPATLLAYLDSWTVSFTHDLADVTTLADTQRRWVAGLADSSGSFTGFLDDATSQAYIAATDGLPRNMYLYPSSRNMGQFFSGQILPDMASTAGVTGPVAITVNWVPSTGVTRTDDFGTYQDVYTDPYT